MIEAEKDYPDLTSEVLAYLFFSPFFPYVISIFSRIIMDELEERGINLNELSEEQRITLVDRLGIGSMIFLGEMLEINENLDHDDISFVRLIDAFNDDIYPFTLFKDIKNDENLILTAKWSGVSIIGFVFVELDGNSATILCFKATPLLSAEYRKIIMEKLWQELKTRLESANIRRIKAFAYPDTQLAKFYEKIGFRKISEKYMVFGKSSIRCDTSEINPIYVVGLTTNYKDNATKIVEYEYVLSSARDYQDNNKKSRSKNTT